MRYADAVDMSASDQWSILALLVEAGLSLYNGNLRVAVLQLGAAALTSRSGLLGTIARVGIELYKRLR
jgi:hypothetical protein